MPAGMVRPRASQVAKLGAGALAEYREKGWRITEFGNVGAGTTTGPCALCREPHERYGEHGRAVCVDCSRAL